MSDIQVWFLRVWLLCSLVLAPGVLDAQQAAPRTGDSSWQTLQQATQQSDYAEVSRSSAAFIAEAAIDDERLPEAWYRFAQAHRELLRDYGEGPYDRLADVVYRIYKQFPESEWTLRAHELLAEEGARRAAGRDHIHPAYGGSVRDALKLLFRDNSQAGMLRLAHYAHNWILAQRGMCDLGRYWQQTGRGTISFVNEILGFLGSSGDSKELKAARQYAAASMWHALGAQYTEPGYWIRDAFPDEEAYAKALAELQSPDPRTRWEQATWQALSSVVENPVLQALGEIPFPTERK